MADDNTTSKALRLPSAINPYSAFTDIILEEQEQIFNEAYETITNQNIQEVKAKGLEATIAYINSQKYNFDKGFDWRLLTISKIQQTNY